MSQSLERLAGDRALLKRLARGTSPAQSVAGHVAQLEEIYREVIDSKTAPVAERVL